MKTELLKDHIKRLYCTQQHFSECFGLNAVTVRRWCCEGRYVFDIGSDIEILSPKRYKKVVE